MRNVAAVLLAIAALWAIGVANPPTPSTLQGDVLGMQPGETAQEYAQRAAGTMQDQRAFALVTFLEAVSAARAAEAVEGVGRVNGIVVKQKVPIAVPEPAEGLTRADVFRRAAGEEIAALIVYDGPDTLQAVAGRDGVLAVEALPPDAVWGAFTVGEVP